MKNILIVYYVPPNTVKYNNWTDGFTSALDIIASQFNIIKYNLADNQTVLNNNYFKTNNIDLILVKSNWNARIDRFFRQKLLNIETKKGLLISGSLPPPNQEALNYYDILFYETDWYKKFVKNHKNIVHAFGIDTEIMRPINGLEKKYDWLTVGKFKNYKRQYKLLEKTGKRLAIGEMPYNTSIFYYFSESNRILRNLKRGNIEVIDFVAYENLCTIYNKTKNVYIPAKLQGGGERAILEARACEVPNIEIEPDNPKLQSLLNSPIYSHTYYAEQLKNGINSLI